MRNRFINLNLIFSIIIFTASFIYSIDYKNTSILCLILLFPIAIILTLKFIFYFTNKKFIHIFINFISAFILLVTLFSGIIICSFKYYHVKYDVEPMINEYSEALNKITDKKYAIEHFPSVIPDNAQNYYFYLNKRFKDFEYLEFNIDENYINQVNLKNKNFIIEEIKFKETCNKYHTICEEVKDEKLKNGTVYILRNKNNDTQYTSGYIVSKEKDKILFFYSYLNLKIEKYSM